MKTTLQISVQLAALLSAASLRAADATNAVVNVANPTWHAQTLLQAVGNLFLFAAAGVVAAIAGYKLFDKCTPGDLNREILEHRNVAAAIIAAAVILGVCIIVAASMLG